MARLKKKKSSSAVNTDLENNKIFDSPVVSLKQFDQANYLLIIKPQIWKESRRE